MYKIALVAALCVAQGFAFKPRDQFPAKGPCKTPAFGIEEKIPQDLEEAMHEMDEVTETVSMSAVEAYFKGNDPDVIIECFREQKNNFAKLGQKIHRKLQEANREIAELLGDKYEVYAKRIEGPLRTIGLTMITYPVKVWSLIKEKEFTKALEVMRESRRIIQENSRVLADIMKEMAEEFPECAQRAEELSREIREEVKTGCQTIGEEIRKCVEAGGPQKFTQDETESGAQLEEAPER